MGLRKLMIVTSRLADERLWAEALNLGAYDVLAKPFDRTEAMRVVAAAWRDVVRVEGVLARVCGSAGLVVATNHHRELGAERKRCGEGEYKTGERFEHLDISTVKRGQPIVSCPGIAK